MTFGVMQTAALLRTGWSRARIDRAVRAGRLHPLRRGWFAAPDADQDAVRAVRAGGALSCISALVKHDVWVPEHHELHVRPARSGSVRHSPGLRTCFGLRSEHAPTTAVDSVPVALASALRCQSFENCVVLIDSVLNKELMTVDDVATVVRRLHGNNRRLLKACNPLAQSGTETMARLRLLAQGYQVEVQVPIAGVGWVDLMIGDRLVIEIDSVKHHTSLENYRKDRARDRRLKALGYRVLRLTYQDVVHGWAEVEQDIAAMVARNEHRWPRRRSS